MLQPAAPNRKPIHIDKVVKKIIKEKLDTVGLSTKLIDNFILINSLKLTKINNKYHISHLMENIITNQALESFMKMEYVMGFQEKYILNEKII